MPSRNWLTDFEITPGVVRVKASGVKVAMSWDNTRELARWTGYFLRVRREAPQAGTGGFSIAFTPVRARPWYLIWPVARMAGAEIVDDPALADLVMHFEDATEGEPRRPPALKDGARLLNFGCRSVSKSAVAAAFEAAFGYPLHVDPRRAEGPIVEKSEFNGAHDGRIASAPLEPAPGCVYQRLVDNRGALGLMEDLRTPTLAGKPLCVFIKRRKLADRFTNHNQDCVLKTPEETYTPAEIAAIGRFCAALGLDWGGLDVLRDARDGRLYVVDANKTDMGPPIALALDAQLRATRAMAESLRAFARPAQ
jgi:hypothetical protein